MIRFIVALLLMTGTAMAQVQNRTYQDSMGRNLLNATRSPAWGWSVGVLISIRQSRSKLRGIFLVFRLGRRRQGVRRAISR